MGDARLRPTTRQRIDRMWSSGGSVLVSAVTAWEVALLADTGRIILDSPAEDWIERFLGRPGVEGVPLTWRAAARACSLPHLEHRDPADRLLVATALDLGCELVTCDGRITAFAAGHGRRYGLKVSAY